VITGGIDLAAQAKRTATATIEWAGGRAFIRDVTCPAEDDAIVSLIEQAERPESTARSAGLTRSSISWRIITQARSACPEPEPAVAGRKS